MRRRCRPPGTARPRSRGRAFLRLAQHVHDLVCVPPSSHPPAAVACLTEQFQFGELPKQVGCALRRDPEVSNYVAGGEDGVAEEQVDHLARAAPAPAETGSVSLSQVRQLFCPVNGPAGLCGNGPEEEPQPPLHVAPLTDPLEMIDIQLLLAFE